MLSVYIYFHDATPAGVKRSFDAKFGGGFATWMFGTHIWIDLYEDMEEELEQEVLEKLRALTGRREIVMVAADVSGKIPGDEEVLAFCSLVLGEHRGWAMDDHTDHLWTLEEIRSGHLHEGHPFFDYRGWYEERKKRQESDGRVDADEVSAAADPDSDGDGCGRTDEERNGGIGWRTLCVMAALVTWALWVLLGSW